MTLFRAGVVSLSLVLLAACGGDGGSDADGSVTTATTTTDGDLEANGSEVEAIDDDEVIDAELVPVSGCVVSASEIDLTPVWKGQAPGLAVIVSRDDQPIYTTQPAAADSTGEGAFGDVEVEIGVAYRYSIETVDRDGNRSESVPCGSGQLLAQSSDVACGVRVSDAGLPEVSWEGVLLVQQVAVLRNGDEVGTDATTPFVDINAPVGAASSYSIVVSDSTDQGREEQTIDCGDAAPNVADAGGTVDLAGAIEASNNFLSPFQYVQLEPICPDCASTAELYLVPSSADPTIHAVDKVWIGGTESNDRDEPWMIDPLTVAEVLGEAQRSGSNVTYTIDFDTGLVREWTIDGVGARYLCFEVDTAPLEARSRDCGANIFTG